MYLTSDEECQLSSWWFAQHIDVYFIIYEAKYPRNENKWAVREIREVDKESCPFQRVCKLKKHKFTHMHKSQCVLSNMCISTLIFLSSDINRLILHTSPPKKGTCLNVLRFVMSLSLSPATIVCFLACTAAFFLRKLKCLYPGWQRKYKWKRKASTLLYCQMHIIFLSGEIFLQICCKELPARLVYDVASSISISFDEDGDASFLSYSSAPYKPVTIFVVLIKHKPAQLFLFLFFQQQAAQVKFLCQEPPT